MEKNAEYLRLLQERNKLKKIMLTKTKDEVIKEELERGFKTQFRGANASKDNEKTAPPVKLNSKPSSVINKLILDTNKVWGKHQQVAKDDYRNQFNFNNSSSPNIIDSDVVKEEIDSDYEADFDEPSDIDENKINNNVMVSGSWNEEDEKNIQLYINELKHSSSEIINQSQPSITAGEEVTENKIIDERKDNSLQTTDNLSSQVCETMLLETGFGDNVDLDSSLQSRVKVLSVDQKRKLLQLLKTEESSTDVVSVTDVLRIGTTIHNNNDFVIEDTNKLQNVGSSHIPNATIVLECRSDDNDKKTNEKKQLDDTILGCNPKIDSTISTQLLLIRIKILTQWSKSKFISLRAIRLRALSSIAGQKYLDLLQHFKVRVNSGMVSIPNNSETVRNLSILTSGSNKSSLLMPLLDVKSYYPVSKTADQSNLYWKAPFTSDKPVEIIFEADLEKVSIFSNQPYHQVLEKLSLMLWNNEFQIENSSAVKDVDIYIGSLCIWSGQLQEEVEHRFQSTSTSNMKSNELIIHNEMPPTLTLSTLSVSTKINKTIKAEILRSSNESIRNVDSTTEELTNKVNINFKQEATKPNWLIEDNSYLPPHTVQNNIIDHIVTSNSNYLAPKSASRRSRNRDDNPDDPKHKLQLSTTLPSNTLEATDNIISASKIKPFSRLKLLNNENNILATPTKLESINSNHSSDSKQRGIRRNRNHLLKEVNQRGSPSKSNIDGDIPFSDAINSFQTEEELENSLDAISFAQKFDMGRLTNNLPKKKSLVTDGDSDIIMSDDPVYNADLEDSLDVHNQQDVVDYTLKEDSLTHNHHIVQSPSKIKNTNILSSNDLAYYSPTKQSNRGMTNRSARIDLVQEKITSTLAGLAHIISSIPVSTSTLKNSDVVNDKPQANNLIADDTSDSIVMPFGSIVTIDILSTWGDENYVGLNGLEFYDELGRLVVPNLKSSDVSHCKSHENASVISISAYPSGLDDVTGKVNYTLYLKYNIINIVL